MKVFNSFVLFILISVSALSQNSLTSVSSFGTNPGNLNMYHYVPSGISQSTSLVLALHGCTQTANVYAIQSGWNKLADLHKFIVVYPEQVAANNSSKCFNWFDATDQTKGQGEALSIKQMVDYMKSHFAIDSGKIFITGLSAGGGMTSVMLAAYPELFDKGAVMAGLPYKAASSSFTAFSAMGGSVVKTPVQWGNLVRNQNPNYSGKFPRVAIFHGSSDGTVNIANATELIDQWTDVNTADQIADATNNAFHGNTNVEQKIYTNNLNDSVVYYYKITGMGHAIALDTGVCPQQGGATATYAIDKNFHSTYWAADFFGIIANPYSITGAIQVNLNATNINYTVPNNSGSIYTWTIPTGAAVINGQGTHSITINFGTSSGYVTVQETTGAGCIYDIASLFITVAVQYNVNVSQIASINCNGDATATLYAAATGGTPPYTYNWYPAGGNSSIATGLEAGVYTVTVMDSISTVINSNAFTISEPAVISETQTTTLCEGQIITVGEHIYNTTGTYIDTLISINGCDSVLITHLTIQPLSPVYLSIMGNDSLCDNESAFALSGGLPFGGVYGGPGVVSGNFNPLMANQGWNVITYTFTDGNNCSSTITDSLYKSACVTTNSVDWLGFQVSQVYPNPVAEVITVSLNETIASFELEVYDSFGALVLAEKFNANTVQLNIRKWKAGLYVFNIKTKESIISKNILKR